MRLFPRQAGRVALAGAVLLPLAGCSLARAPVLDPDGPVGRTELHLLLVTTGLMLIVVVPVFVLTFWFAWHYRASNHEATYRPDWSYSRRLDLVIWLVPALIVVAIGYLVWSYTHSLDPYRPLAGSARPLEVRVISQDWKWLFLYPEQKVAVVNELVFPAGRPLDLLLTSDTVMNGFYVPGLGSQIYTMAGMRTELHLAADRPGRFVGRNVQYSGRGFADQHFAVRATSEKGFAAWLAEVRRSPKVLDAASYAALSRPKAKVPVTYYSSYRPGLFDRIVRKYAAASPPATRRADASNGPGPG